MSIGFSREYEEAGRIAGQPIPIKPAIPEAGEYPIEALSPKLQAAARAIVDKVQVAPAVAAQSVLAAAALAVQPFIDVEMPTGERIPTSLFLITVAGSGNRKSSCDKWALRGVRQREHDLHIEHQSDNARFLIEQAAFGAAKKKALTGSKSREQIARDIEACGPEPLPPPLPMLISDEGTLQGLQKLFAEAMPSLGLFSDEGGQWLGGFAMSEENRGQTGAALSKLWDGAPIKRVRGGDGVTILRGRRLSVHLMIQDRIAKRLFGDAELKDQGLLSRLMVASPTSIMGSRHWHDPAADSAFDLEKFDARVLGLLRAPMPMDPETRELTPATIPLSAGARELFIKWHDAVETELGKDGAFAQITGFAGKLPEHSVRVAAVMAYFEDRKLTEISAAALSAGIKIAKFHAEEALRLFGVGSVDQDTDNAAMLIEWITGKGLTAVGVRTLSRHAPAPVRPAPVLKRAIALLVEMGHLHRIEGGAEIEYRGKPEMCREAYTVIADEESA